MVATVSCLVIRNTFSDSIDRMHFTIFPMIRSEKDVRFIFRFFSAQMTSISTSRLTPLPNLQGKEDCNRVMTAQMQIVKYSMPFHFFLRISASLSSHPIVGSPLYRFCQTNQAYTIMPVFVLPSFRNRSPRRG